MCQMICVKIVLVWLSNKILGLDWLPSAKSLRTTDLHCRLPVDPTGNHQRVS